MPWARSSPVMRAGRETSPRIKACIRRSRGALAGEHTWRKRRRQRIRHPLAAPPRGGGEFSSGCATSSPRFSRGLWLGSRTPPGKCSPGQNRPGLSRTRPDSSRCDKLDEFTSPQVTGWWSARGRRADGCRCVIARQCPRRETAGPCKWADTKHCAQRCDRASVIRASASAREGVYEMGTRHGGADCRSTPPTASMKGMRTSRTLPDHTGPPPKGARGQTTSRCSMRERHRIDRTRGSVQICLNCGGPPPRDSRMRT